MSVEQPEESLFSVYLIDDTVITDVICWDESCYARLGTRQYIQFTANKNICRNT